LEKWRNQNLVWEFAHTKGKFILLKISKFKNINLSYRLLYIVGGCTHQTRHLQDLLSYNPLTTEWETLSPMKVPRSQMGIVVVNGYLYAIGGSSRSSEVLKSVEKYSFAEDCWTEVCSMKIGRANPAVGAVDGKIYCIGGDQTVEQNFFRAQVTLATVEVYDPLIGNWEDCENLPESRSEAGYVVI
jgi:N-acetylneuraminic acid mutarotase